MATTTPKAAQRAEQFKAEAVDVTISDPYDGFDEYSMMELGGKFSAPPIYTSRPISGMWSLVIPAGSAIVLLQYDQRENSFIEALEIKGGLPAGSSISYVWELPNSAGAPELFVFADGVFRVDTSNRKFHAVNSDQFSEVYCHAAVNQHNRSAVLLGTDNGVFCHSATGLAAHAPYSWFRGKEIRAICPFIQDVKNGLGGMVHYDGVFAAVGRELIFLDLDSNRAVDYAKISGGAEIMVKIAKFLDGIICVGDFKNVDNRNALSSSVGGCFSLNLGGTPAALPGIRAGSILSVVPITTNTMMLAGSDCMGFGSSIGYINTNIGQCSRPAGNIEAGTGIALLKIGFNTALLLQIEKKHGCLEVYKIFKV